MIEVLKQALEALETTWYHVGTFAPTDDAIELYDQARTSLRQAISELEQRSIAELESQEPFTYYRHYDGGTQEWPDERTIPLYTHPPQRTWVGLTDEEAQQTFARHNCTISTHLAGILTRTIEAKLKEKNT